MQQGVSSNGCPLTMLAASSSTAALMAAWPSRLGSRAASNPILLLFALAAYSALHCIPILQQSFGLLLVIHHGLQSKQRGHRWGSGMGRYSQHRALPFRHGQRGYAAMCPHAQRGLNASVWTTLARGWHGHPDAGTLLAAITSGCTFRQSKVKTPADDMEGQEHSPLLPP
jgi:hypothetical protein